MLNKIHKKDYLLLFSDDPVHLFNYFDVHEMHGLYIDECQHIEGLCNYIPNKNKKYDLTDPCFVFINTSVYTDPIKVFGLIMHEMIHLSLKKYQWNLHREEEIITWAEEQAYEVYSDIIKH